MNKIHFEHYNKIKLPLKFENVSYQHDECSSFKYNEYHIYIYKNEVFTVFINEDEEILNTNKMSDVLKVINYKE